MQSIDNTSSALTDFRTKILGYKAPIDDLNATGEQIFGQAASANQLKEVEERNRGLERERDELRQKIKDFRSIAEATARDFQDLKAKTPDPYPTKRLNVLEDYTLAIFLSALAFFCLTFLFLYIRITGFSMLNLLAGSFLVFLILGITLSFLFYLA